MSDDNVTPLRRGNPEESVANQLLRIATSVESRPPAHAVELGFVILVADSGRMEIHQLGKEQDDLKNLGLLKVAEQVIIDDMMGV